MSKDAVFENMNAIRDLIEGAMLILDPVRKKLSPEKRNYPSGENSASYWINSIHRFLDAIEENEEKILENNSQLIDRSNTIKTRLIPNIRDNGIQHSIGILNGTITSDVPLNIDKDQKRKVLTDLQEISDLINEIEEFVEKRESEQKQNVKITQKETSKAQTTPPPNKTGIKLKIPKDHIFGGRDTRGNR